MTMHETLHDAMLNSYKVIVEKKDPYEMIETSEDKEIIFAHHIDKTITSEDIDLMIAWWEEEEEYEMCGQLLKIGNGIKRLSKRHRSERV